MLLQLNNTNAKKLYKLFHYAQQNNLDLTLVDDAKGNYHLPGKPLSNEELNRFIAKSRSSGKIDLENAHKLIRNNYNADQLHVDAFSAS